MICGFVICNRNSNKENESKLTLYSFVEQWSARQSVTLEIAGSIPVEAAIILTKEDFAYDCIC